MKLIMFTGFLGSGKTSMALSYAHFLSARNLTTAFVVNEAGDVSLDGQWIQEQDYRVEEVFAGCICCQVSTDFVYALNRIKTKEQPDQIIIEPSGIADPVNLKELLEKSGYHTIPIVNIVDLSRFAFLAKATPLIHHGLKSATMVILNKIDLSTSSSEIKAVKQVLQEQYSQTPFHFLSAKGGIPDTVWQEVSKL